MKTAVITGTSKGIGLACANLLLDNNIKVIGISRSSSGIEHPNFTEYLVDLADFSQLDKLINTLSNDSIDILINNAGVAYYGPCETISSKHIAEMTAVNITAPMILTSGLLRSLITTKGIVINISSITAKNANNTHGAVYGATKAALSNFGDSLFCEIRKRGVRVANLHPDLTDTALYRNADFKPASEDGCKLMPEQVADMVYQVISMPEGSLIRDITLSPQFNRITRDI